MSQSLKYNLIDVSGQGNITVVVDGEMYVASSDHPNWAGIVQGAQDFDPDVIDLFDTSKAVAQKFESLSERVSVSSGRIFFDGEEINNALTEQVLSFLAEGVDDYKPLIRFWEKVATNPQQDSREQLFRFIQQNGITIHEDGDLVLYKGVRNDGLQWTSISQGPAVVNGEAVSGHVPQPIGGVVEMARAKVAFDPSVPCSTGLHAGAWSYANSFGGGNVLTVKINPRDVVSVPKDSNDQKVRVCRYTVIDVVKAEITTVVHGSWYDDEDDDYCDDCDERIDDCDCDD